MRALLILVLAIVAVGCTVEATDALPVAPAAAPNGVAGTLLEARDASNYTYLRIETAGGEVWAAVPQARLEVGSQVAIANPQAMSNFESKTLGRSFDKIYFGTLEGGDGSSPHGSMRKAAAGGEPDAKAAPIKVAKAEGASGRTVAELFAGKDDLSGKSVAIRGKVVKYNANIMGLNWIHIQDGSGAAADGNHDITVTTADSTAVGEIVLIEGVVAVDKNFGSGYRYDLIVENASVK